MSDTPLIPSSRDIFQQRNQITRTPRVGGRAALTTTTNTTVYTAPTPTSNPTGTDFATAVVTSIVLHNTDSASARTITVHVVESGGSVADNRENFKLSLAADETYIIEWGDKGLPMHPGEFVNLIAGTADTITYRIHVEELTL